MSPGADHPEQPRNTTRIALPTPLLPQPLPLDVWGDVRLLRRPLLGLLCSERCPGDAILALVDTCRALARQRTALVGGFDSPLEQEALFWLLRGRSPLVVCPARGLAHFRLPQGWADPLRDGRLALVSPFASSVRRKNRGTALRRNRLVAALSRGLLVAHVEPGGMTEKVVTAALGWGRPVWALDVQSNAPLWEQGVAPFDWETVERTFVDREERQHAG